MSRLLPVLFMLSLLMVTRAPADASTDEPFSRGRQLLQAGKFDEAAKQFALAREVWDIIGDYALLYQARALHEAQALDESSAAAANLLSGYPDSPLAGVAQSLIIRNAASGDWDHAIELLKGYLEHHPLDDDMKFLYADLLIKRGDSRQAEPILRQIYLAGGPRADEALMHIDHKEFTVPELTLRGASLTLRQDYQAAEAAFRQALAASETAPLELQEGLAFCLYRQKKYHEAARLYRKLGNMFQAAKSYLRAGEREQFENSLDELLEDDNENAVELLVAKSMEYQEEGDWDKALSVLEEAVEKFPDNAETARWRMGWVRFRQSEYVEAASIFSSLARDHDSDRYRYWQARALEQAGKDALNVFRSIEGEDFYSYLAQIRLGPAQTTSLKKASAPGATLPNLRVQALMEVELLDEAAEEISLEARRANQSATLIGLARALVSIGKYYQAMVMLNRVEERLRPADIIYPLAYWAEVSEASLRYGVDPFLLLSLIREESRFDSRAHSSAGARGLMQLMLGTAQREARAIGLHLEDAESLYDPTLNVRLGARYFSSLLEKFKSVSAALAAYNAGETKVRAWLDKGGYGEYDEFIEDMPYRETRNYVKRILTSYFRYRGVRYSYLPEGTPSL